MRVRTGVALVGALAAAGAATRLRRSRDGAPSDEPSVQLGESPEPEEHEAEAEQPRPPSTLPTAAAPRYAPEPAAAPEPIAAADPPAAAGPPPATARAAVTPPLPNELPLPAAPPGSSEVTLADEPLPAPEPPSMPLPASRPLPADDSIPEGWTIVDFSSGVPMGLAAVPAVPQRRTGDGELRGVSATRRGPRRLRAVGGAAVVAEAEARLRPLSVDANVAAWSANTEASPETEARRVETELALTDLLAEPDLFRAVVEARISETDPEMRRELDLLHDAFLPHQVPAALRRRIVELEASVESRFVTHRGVVGGREVADNEIKRILRSSDDPHERREAWEAAKTVGAAVSDDVRELARLRNEAARSVGHRDWFELAVATMEMSEEKLFDTLAEADLATGTVFRRWKGALDESLAARFGCDTSALRPWHYADPFFQEVPVEGGVELDHVFAGRDLIELTRRTFSGLGFDTAPILGRSDLYPRERKNQHAFCLDVDREGDIRVLCNIVDDASWMDTMLHELGHGVFSAGHDPALPWLLRDCHLTTTEGIALLMGRLAADGEWLERVAGMSAEDARDLAHPLDAARAAAHVVFARWVLVMTNFERALYGDPDGDLDRTWWELVARYQALTPPDDRRAPDWAAKIHVACAPVYYHTYLYGAVTASQLAAALKREAGGIVDRPAAGAFLSERLFRPGMTLRWDELLEQASGEPLTTRYYAAEIAQGLAA